MLWWQSVEGALSNLGGTATLKDLYEEVRKLRKQSGDSIPPSLEAVVRRELEYNSSDSTQWRRVRNVFFSVHGKGEGVWGLRAHIAIEPDASDMALPEPLVGTPTISVTVNRIIRDTVMSRKVKSLHHSRCQLCGTSIKLPGDRNYAEGHHIIPLGKPHGGPDTPSNIIVVCPNHHAMLDLGCIELDLSALLAIPGHSISAASIDYHNRVIVVAAGAASQVSA